jgi:uncharacterized repeat protein (TIGR03803 family)
VKTLTLQRRALGFCPIVALLAGCGGSQPPISAPNAVPQTSAIAGRANDATVRTQPDLAYSLLYSFTGWPKDGQYPAAGLVNVNGTLYGTTFIGGHGCRESQGCGVVFGFTKTRGEFVLRSFGYKSGEGDYPAAGLIDVNGTLYGTTTVNGAVGGGTVYAITASGKETVLHSFGGTGDGALPHADLTNVNGTLYGTTVDGGVNGDGTVFSVTPSGAETILHSFGGGSEDGAFPEAALTNVKGTLYGTTENGGGKGCFENEGCGTVFTITTSGKETVLHTFGGSRDGYEPEAGLTDVRGALYGTTMYGGADCGISGDMCGTVFAITTSGKETVLRTFGGSGDGYDPEAGLINVKGTLYGTTLLGGPNDCNEVSCGTVFAITTSGTETVLHTFAGYPTDGAFPQAALLDVNGTLYGTTWSGGTVNSAKCDGGCGTIFSIKP